MGMCRAAVFLAIATTLLADIAQGQIVRRLGGGGIAIRAPFAPPVNVQFGRPLLPGVLPRGRAFGSPYNGPAPLYAAPPVIGYGSMATLPTAPRPTTVARPALPAESRLPSVAELQAMDDSTLLNTVVSFTQQLNADLAHFDTGSMWQEYLQLPSDALPPPSGNRVTLGLPSIRRTIERFDAIAADPAYVKISSQASFVASRAALVELVRRFGNRPSAPTTPPQTPPAQSEELPPPSSRPAAPVAGSAVLDRSTTPTLAAPDNGRDDERSILTK